MTRNTRLVSLVLHGPTALLLAIVAMVGCGGGADAPPSVESLMAIENVGKWYQVYRARHGGKPPEDEAGFLEFVNGELSKRGEATVDAEKLLTSPRDGARYVVLYGKLASRDPESNVVAHERDGVNGLKLIVTELARSRVVDDAELQSILPSE